MRKWIVRAWVGTAVITALLAIMVSPASAGQSDLSAVRTATASFQDLDKAMKAGYMPLLSCFDQVGVGGMGQHYVNLSLLNSSVDVAQPEALVYEVDGNRLQLVAVEYIIPQAAWTSSEPPSLYGRSFTRNDALGLWALHAWIWRPNPNGIFANYNPSVKMCPGH